MILYDNAIPAILSTTLKGSRALARMKCGGCCVLLSSIILLFYRVFA